MKRIYTLLLALLTLAACQDGNDFGDDRMPGLQPKRIPYSLEVSPSSVTLSSEAQTASITVTANGKWTANVSEDAFSWCSVSPDSGSKSGTITLTVLANTDTETRTATITIMGKTSDDERKVTVTQIGAGPWLAVEPANLDFSAGGGTKTIAVASNVSWTVTSDLWWCIISPDSGTGNGTITVTSGANTSIISHTGTITVTAGTETREISVEQAGKTASLVPYIYFIGATDVWSNPEQRLALTDNDGIYTGFLYCADNDMGNEFKFQCIPNDWDSQINSLDMTGGINGDFAVGEDYESNFKASAGDGVYFVTLNLPERTINGKRIYNMNIAGSFNGWNAADDAQQMTWNTTDYCYEIIGSAVTTDGFGWKFVANNDWDINLGAKSGPEPSPNINDLVVNGLNLDADGNVIKLYPTRRTSDNIFCTVESRNIDAVRTFTVTGNGKTVTFKMIRVEGGTFMMGATDEQGSDAENDEKPAHSVTISKDYYMGETEVTQALWYAVMGQKPTSDGSQWSSSYGLGDSRPAYHISWNDCTQFFTTLNQKLADQLGSGEQFRFPTEAEWEFAARGGNKSKGYKYAGSNTIGDVAWYTVNSYDKGSSSSDYGTHDVGTKAPNELGLYNMSGNVWEWCQDWYNSSYYSSSPTTDPTGPTTGSSRVNRGGSWGHGARFCRVSYRRSWDAGYRSYYLGLRLALQ